MLNSATLPPIRSLAGKITVAAAMTALADTLFYWQPVGCTVAIYAVLLLAVLITMHQNIWRTPAGRIVTGLCAALVYAMAEEPTLLTMLMFATGIGTLLFLTQYNLPDDARLWFGKLWRFWLALPFRQNRDRRALKCTARRWFAPGVESSWTVLKYAVPPVLLGLIFIVLFATANPLLKPLLDMLNWDTFINMLSPLRWMFWFGVSSCLWGLFRPRFMRIARPGNRHDGSFAAFWFNDASIAFSLTCFNIIFALQNGLDIIFLWSGQALPNGMSYAEYAQAGAYPLMITTLLAAGYVLLTFGTKRSATFYRPMARALVYVWIAQNIFLLISAINRNLQYIEAYSLTYLRLGAMIWMALVALGFVLIVIKIMLGMSNIWLINTNTLALLATLYGACFVNFDGMIADYNVRHTREITGEGPFLDLAYMRSLGPDALPALFWYQQNASKTLAPHILIDIDMTATELQQQLQQQIGANWRGLTLRRQRLRELSATTIKPAPMPPLYTPPAVKPAPSQPLYAPPPNHKESNLDHDHDIAYACKKRRKDIANDPAYTCRR